MRVISLDLLTVAYLRRHLAMLGTEKEVSRDSYHDSGLLVCHPDGRPVHPDSITESFNKLIRSSAFACTTCGTSTHYQFDAGLDPKIVADRIGHVNMAYTLAVRNRPGRTGARPRP
jgi:hypothetical protein